MREYLRSRRLLPAILSTLATLLLPAAAHAGRCTDTAKCLRTGDFTYRIASGGETRSYLVHVPASYSPGKEVPLLVDLHGFTSTADQQRLISGQLEESDDRGFIAVWPQGLNNSWNAYNCCGWSLLGQVDDVGFIRLVVGEIKRRASIDDARVYVTGLSNGGAMAHRLACEATDVFAAAAAVSQTLNRTITQCQPARPITVYEFHGTADILVNYWGLGFFQSASASRDLWGKIDQCTGGFSTASLPVGSRSEIYGTCAAGVRTGLITIANGQHVLYDNPSIDLARYMWTNVFGS